MSIFEKKEKSPFLASYISITTRYSTPPCEPRLPSKILRLIPSAEVPVEHTLSGARMHLSGRGRTLPHVNLRVHRPYVVKKDKKSDNKKRSNPKRTVYLRASLAWPQA